MLRLRLIETEKFLGCRDRDSSRLGNLLDVETETSRDWAKDVDTETPSRLSLIPAPNKFSNSILITQPKLDINSLIWEGMTKDIGYSCLSAILQIHMQFSIYVLVCNWPSIHSYSDRCNQNLAFTTLRDTPAQIKV